MHHPPLQPSQVALFHTQGCLQLKGFHPRARMGEIEKAVLEELKRLRIWVSGKSLSSPVRELPPFQQIARLSTLVKVPGLHAAVMTPQLSSIIAFLAGRAPSPVLATQGSQFLLSLPHQGRWALEGLNWHVDVASEAPDQLPGIQAFVLVADVAPRGGATLALAGSHRAGTRQAPLRELLKKSGNLEAGLGALGIHVVEMSGQAGDVFLMDMRLLHTPALNATKHIRMMATARFFLRT